MATMAPNRSGATEVAPQLQVEEWTDELISRYKLEVHVEGGYFAETDRSPMRVPNTLTPKGGEETRATSTTIYYLLTAGRPAAYFHRNRSRTVHCLHEGKGIYILLYPPSSGTGPQTAHIEAVTRGSYTRQKLNSGWTLEVFEVGKDVGVYQWLVEGNAYKCSFLRDFNTRDGELQMRRGSTSGPNSRAGLFISEVVSPGFEFADHNFLSWDDFDVIFCGRGQEYNALVNPAEISQD